MGNPFLSPASPQEHASYGGPERCGEVVLKPLTLGDTREVGLEQDEGIEVTSGYPDTLPRGRVHRHFNLKFGRCRVLSVNLCVKSLWLVLPELPRALSPLHCQYLLPTPIPQSHLGSVRLMSSDTCCKYSVPYTTTGSESPNSSGDNKKERNSSQSTEGARA